MEDKNPTQPLKPLQEGKSDAAEFPADGVLGLEVPEGKLPLIFRPKPGDVVSLGRKSVAIGPLDVDLSPYGAYGMGVSRNHAEIRRSVTGEAIELRDLGSSNGTFYNDERLTWHGKQRLAHGDEFRLGDMKIRVLFLRGDVPASKDVKAVTPPKAQEATLDLQQEIAKLKNSPLMRRATSKLDPASLPDFVEKQLAPVEEPKPAEKPAEAPTSAVPVADEVNADTVITGQKTTEPAPEAPPKPVDPPAGGEATTQFKPADQEGKG